MEYVKGKSGDILKNKDTRVKKMRLDRAENLFKK